MFDHSRFDFTCDLFLETVKIFNVNSDIMEEFGTLYFILC